MNYFFKAAAGAMSALILASGAGFTADLNRDCTRSLPDPCSLSAECSSEADCISISTADLEKLLHECENTSDLLNILIENGLCSKDEPNCITDTDGCTADNICNPLEGCDIVHETDFACAEDTGAACEGKAGEDGISDSLSRDEQTVTDISDDSGVVSEQPCDSIESCSDNNCTSPCDTDTDSKSVTCDDNDRSCESSAEKDCGESDCSSDACKDSRIDFDCHQKSTYGNIYDILRSYGIEISTNSACDPDSGCNENTNQTDTTRPETDMETDNVNDIEAFEISDYEKEVIRLVNEIRVSYGLGELTLNEELSAVARLKSEDMRDNYYFSHNSPTFGSPFEMMSHFGINYRTAGENIAMGQKTPREVVDGWMNSEGHRANILNGSFTEIGVGYAENGHYWTQMFIG